MTSLPSLSILCFLVFFSQIMGNIGNHEHLSSIESIKQLIGCCEKGRKAQGLNQLKLYLARFGYLNYQNTPNRANTEEDKFDDELKAALKSYQKYYHLNATGTLDGPTISQMVMPRCGLPDKNTHTHGLESPHITPHFKFYPNSNRWPPGKSHLIYAFPLNYADRHVPPVVRALEQWSTATHYFNFFNTADFKRADLKISFDKTKHENDDSDGPGHVLAHASRPPHGMLHFHMEEVFSDGPRTDPKLMDLETVAAHGIGHLLGLAHSQDRDAIMFPMYNLGVKKSLNADDIKGIKFLYKLK